MTTHDYRQPGFLAGLIGIVLCCVPFYLSYVIPMTDVPQHVLIARILLDYDAPDLRFSEFFDIDWAFVPTTLFYIVLAGIQKIVGPFWDAKVILTLWVVANWLAMGYLARVLDCREPWIVALAALPLTGCWYVYQGYLPFLMSLPVFTATLGVWFNQWPPVRKIAVLWVLLLAAFGFHIVGMAAAAAVIGTSALVQAAQQRSARPVIMGVIAGIPVPILLLVYLLGDNGPSVTIDYQGVWSNTIDVIKYTLTTLHDYAPLALLAWLGLAVAIAAWRFRELRAYLPVLAASFVLAVLACVMPASFGALWPAGPRLLPFAILAFIPVVPWSRITAKGATAALLGILAVICVLNSQATLRLKPDMRDYLGALELVRVGANVLPIKFDPNGGSKWTEPLGNMAAVYTVVRGGSNPYVFASPHTKTGASPVKYRDDVKLPFAYRYEQDQAAQDYQGVSAAYDYVLIWGSLPSVEEALGKEMTEVYESGKAHLYARK